MGNDVLETTVGEYLIQNGGFVKTGPFGTVLKANEYASTGVPLISVREVGYGSLRVDSSTPRVSTEVTDRLPEYILRHGDIVFGRKGAVDRSAHIKESEDGWFLGSDGIMLRLPSTCDSSFIAYQVQSPQTKNWLIQNSTGSTMASLSQGIINRIPLRIPPLPIQKAIAHILGTLDDKIELLRSMNETLEAMARALFKSWFIDFDPVHKKTEGQPTGLPSEIDALFPDSFVDSELGEMPKGWNLGQISDYGIAVNDQILPDAMTGEEYYIGLEHIPRQSISIYDWDVSESVESNKSKFHENDVLFGKLRPYFHKVVIAPVSGVCSTDILVIRPKNTESLGFLLLHLSSKEVIEYTTSFSNGTKMPRTNWGDLGSFKLVAPPRGLIFHYNIVVSEMLKTIKNDIFEMKSLSLIRDSLLPRLISGEIELSDKAISKIMEPANEHRTH